MLRLIFALLLFFPPPDASITELAKALLSAKTESERVSLLAKNKELLGTELRDALLEEGYASRSKGNYDHVFMICDLVERITQQTNDRAGMSATLNLRGLTLRSQDKFTQAIKAFEEALTISKIIGDEEGIARSIQNTGLVHQAQGNYESGLKLVQESVELYEKLGDIKGIARGLNLLGIIQDIQGDHEKALELYQESLRLFEQLGDKVGVANGYLNTGTVLNVLGRNDLAFENYQKAKKVYEETGDKPRLSLVLNNIGNIYLDSANYRLALDCHLRSLKLSEELGSGAGTVRSYINVGLIHELQGNYDLALEFYTKALDKAKSLGDKWLQYSALNNLGSIHILEGRYQDALTYYRTSLKLGEKMGEDFVVVAPIYGVASVYEIMGNYAKARQYFERTLSLREKMGERVKVAESRLALSRIHFHLKGFEQAEQLAVHAYEAAEELQRPELSWAALTQQAKIYRALGDKQKAAKALKDAIVKIESIRALVAGGELDRQQFFGSRVEPYYEMIDLLVSEERNIEAFHYAERVKARVLLDVLQTGRVEITKDLTEKEKAEEKLLIADLASLNLKLRNEKENSSRIPEMKKEIHEARLALESFYATLYAAHPQLKIQRGEIKPVDLERLATLFHPTDAFLEYVVAPDKLFLFLFTKEQVGDSLPKLVVFTIPIRQKDLAKMTGAFRDQLNRRDLRVWSLSKKLYSVLLKPAEKHLAGKERILVVHDRELWELPFQALQIASDQYLLEKFAVSYASSLSVLYEMMKSQLEKISSSLLAFANPKLPDGVSIPESEQEVQTLAKIYGSGEARIWIGENARESTLKSEAAKHGIIHLATHGVLSNASPMYSHLLFATESDSEDGLLEPWEVMNLDLNSSMVVLSACETGRGKIGVGEGVIGFAWAFFVAGSPSIVVSQWKVDSASTTALMLEFHRNLNHHGISKPEALQKAALKLLGDQRYRHPYYWAGFSVIGNPSPIERRL